MTKIPKFVIFVPFVVNDVFLFRHDCCDLNRCVFFNPPVTTL